MEVATEASPYAGKNTEVVLVPCSLLEVHPYSYFPWCGYFWSLSMSFATTDEFSVDSHKNYLKDQCLMNSQPTFLFEPTLTQWIMAILSKGCKLDNFESHNSLKLSFINVWGLHLNFFECESFLESISPDILAVCETNLILAISLWGVISL